MRRISDLAASKPVVTKLLPADPSSPHAHRRADGLRRDSGSPRFLQPRLLNTAPLLRTGGHHIEVAEAPLPTMPAPAWAPACSTSSEPLRASWPTLGVSGKFATGALFFEMGSPGREPFELKEDADATSTTYRAGERPSPPTTGSPTHFIATCRRPRYHRSMVRHRYLSTAVLNASWHTSSRTPTQRSARYRGRAGTRTKRRSAG